MTNHELNIKYINVSPVYINLKFKTISPKET